MKRFVWYGLLLLPLVAGALCFLAARHPGVGMGTALTRCVPCHVSVKLEVDGLAASRLSKGSHPVNAQKIRPQNISTDAHSCGECHRHEYETWRGSVHAQAFTNTIFAHAVSRDREAWCLNCHTPLWSGRANDVEHIVSWLARGTSRGKPMPQELEQGINCAVCHVRDGKIIGSGKKATAATGEKHPVFIDTNLRTEKFCAGCHQFDFPESVKPVVVYQHGPAMQNVVEEHRSLRKADSDKLCGDCHYKGGDHSLHQASGRDMRQRFEIRVVRNPQISNEVTYTLCTPPLGHHFPTGDLFRAVRLTFYSAQGKELYREDFRKEVRVVDQHLVSDTTLRPPRVGEIATMTKRLKLAEAPVSCGLTYHLQANIEPTLAKEGPLTPFIRKLAECRISPLVFGRK